MPTDFIIDVSEANFEYEVTSYSQNMPVVVDFWAEWCQPCKMLTPMLERLAFEAQGAFRLARVDVDANPNLAMMYSVRSLPTVKAFIQGQVSGEMVGLQPENRVRDFLSKLMPPSLTSLAIEKGDGLLQMQNWKEAEQTFRAVLEQSPNESASLLGLTRAMLAQGQPGPAMNILKNFPDSRELTHAEILRPLGEALLDLRSQNLPAENDLDAAFSNTLRLAERGNLEAAMDGLLDILRTNKRYRNGRARLVMLGILEVLGDENPLTRRYRSELATVLF
jgi:putative thioredoxin